MRKPELVKAVAKAATAPTYGTLAVLEALETIVEAELKRGGRVNFPLLGSFAVVERAPRVGRNPRTGDRVEVASRKRPVFRPAARLTKAVAG